MKQETDGLLFLVLGMVMLLPYTAAVTVICVGIFGGPGLLAAPLFYGVSVCFLLWKAGQE